MSDLTLEQAAEQFIASFPGDERWENERELSQFVQWYGREQPVGRLSPPEVANYAQWASASVADPSQRLAPVKAFLAYANKEGLIKANLATHLRVSKSSTARIASSQQRKMSSLTPEGLSRLKAQLETLKEERPRLAEELQSAAADKDFSENAPLDAVRERQGHIEARIRELETAIRSSAILDRESQRGMEVRLGATVTVHDITSGDILSYTLVDPKETNPARGKISFVSPVGKALLGRREGDLVEVNIPAGKLQYQVEKITWMS
jgi:transcription elongation factor GreA